MRCRAATRATAAGPRRRRQRRPRRAPWSGRAGPRRRALVRRVRPSRSLAGGGGVWLAVACGAGARCGAARGGALGRGALVARAPQARKSAALALEAPLGAHTRRSTPERQRCMRPWEGGLQFVAAEGVRVPRLRSESFTRYWRDSSINCLLVPYSTLASCRANAKSASIHLPSASSRRRARSAVLRTAAELPSEAAPSFCGAITEIKEATEGSSCLC